MKAKVMRTTLHFDLRNFVANGLTAKAEDGFVFLDLKRSSAIWWFRRIYMATIDREHTRTKSTSIFFLASQRQPVNLIPSHTNSFLPHVFVCVRIAIAPQYFCNCCRSWYWFVCAIFNTTVYIEASHIVAALTECWLLAACDYTLFEIYFIVSLGGFCFIEFLLLHFMWSSLWMLAHSVSCSSE